MYVRSVFLSFLMFAFVVCGAFALELSGTTFVNVTSNTADAAKTEAFDEARRVIIMEQVGSFADSTQLKRALANATRNDLMDIIVSSSIDGEKVSNTTYSANISMTLDVDATRNWLNNNGVKNWLIDEHIQPINDVKMKTVVFVLQMPVSDWVLVNAIARGVDVDLRVQNIFGKRVVLQIPSEKQDIFVSALRNSCWTVSESLGTLNVWH